MQVAFHYLVENWLALKIKQEKSFDFNILLLRDFNFFRNSWASFAAGK